VEWAASTILTGTTVPEDVLSHPAAIIAAHPDDEVLGVGTLLARLRNLRVLVHVTDGAPRRGSDAANAGAGSWREYAALRRREVESAVEMAGLAGVKLVSLGYADQESSFHIAILAKRLAALFRHFRLAVVFTHAYEGGHPDHDACAAGVHLARSLLGGTGRQPVILEFPLYHAGAHGGMETERFLDGRKRLPNRCWEHTLTEEERRKKRALLGAYSSQQRVLDQFPVRAESIRMSSGYDFRKPPHRGKLYYENFDWGVNGYTWRRLARRAMAQLGVSAAV